MSDIQYSLSNYMAREARKIKEKAKQDPLAVLPPNLREFAGTRISAVESCLERVAASIPGCTFESLPVAARLNKLPHEIFTSILHFEGTDNFIGIKTVSNNIYRYSPHLQVKLCIEKVEMHWYLSYEEEELPAFWGLLDHFPAMIKAFSAQRKHYEKLEAAAKAKAEKRERIIRLRHNSADTWLAEICKDIKYPYKIDKLVTRYDLMILIEENLQIRITIPLNRFQEIMPDIPDLIKTYEELIKNQKTEVFIEHKPLKKWRKRR